MIVLRPSLMYWLCRPDRRRSYSWRRRTRGAGCRQSHAPWCRLSGRGFGRRSGRHASDSVWAAPWGCFRVRFGGVRPASLGRGDGFSSARRRLALEGSGALGGSRCQHGDRRTRLAGGAHRLFRIYTR